MSDAIRTKMARVRAMIGTGVLIRGEPAEEVEDLCELVERFMGQDGPDAPGPDAELAAMDACRRQLESLPEAARRRALWWLVSRLIGWRAAEAMETMAGTPRKDGAK